MTEDSLFNELDEHEQITQLRSDKKPAPKRKHRRTTELVDISTEDEYRRAFGVQELVRLLGMEAPKRGHSYHIISGGNVDLIAHLRWLLIHYPVAQRVFISAWSISAPDILLLSRWIGEGKILTADILVGDVFPSNYKHEFARLTQMYNEGSIRNLYCSNIHSKLILMDAGDDRLVVESSANCNMNPRVEESVVTLNNDLYDFYDRYFRELFAREVTLDTNKELQKLTFD